MLVTRQCHLGLYRNGIRLIESHLLTGVRGVSGHSLRSVHFRVAYDGELDGIEWSMRINPSDRDAIEFFAYANIDHLKWIQFIRDWKRQRHCKTKRETTFRTCIECTTTFSITDGFDHVSEDDCVQQIRYQAVEGYKAGVSFETGELFPLVRNIRRTIRVEYQRKFAGAIEIDRWWGLSVHSE